MKTATKKDHIRRVKVLIRGATLAVKRNTKEIKILEKQLAKLQKRKMRPGGGKPKGGTYEHTIASIIAKELDLHVNDVYRTKNSGAGPKQKGDLQLSSVGTKLLPFTIECKHKKKFNLFHLLVPYVDMQQSWLFKRWWRQLRAECKESGKPGLLIWRANNCPDLCAVRLDQFAAVVPNIYTKTVPHFVVQAKHPIWVMYLSDFLKIIKEGTNGKVHRNKRDKH